MMRTVSGRRFRNWATCLTVASPAGRSSLLVMAQNLQRKDGPSVRCLLLAELWPTLPRSPLERRSLQLPDRSKWYVSIMIGDAGLTG